MTINSYNIKGLNVFIKERKPELQSDLALETVIFFLKNICIKFLTKRKIKQTRKCIIFCLQSFELPLLVPTLDSKSSEIVCVKQESVTKSQQLNINYRRWIRCCDRTFFFFFC